MYFTREEQTAPPETIQASRNTAVQRSTTEEAPGDYSAPVIASVLGGASGDSNRNRGTHILRSAALSSRVNNGLRVVALSRAQQSHGNRFTQQLVTQIQLSSNGTRIVQRECGCGTCAKCSAPAESFASPDAAPVARQFVQTKPNGHLVQAQSSSDEPAAPAVDARELIPQDLGHPLDETTRTDLEERFGADFRGVRVHTDTDAAASANIFGANAFTTGRDIYFAAGKYSPSTQEGKRLLAHELTHVLQQSAGKQPRQGEAVGNGEVVIGAAEDHLEKEADLKAEAVTQPETASQPHAVQSEQPASTSVPTESTPTVQRDKWELGDNPILNTVTSGVSAGVDLIGTGVKKGANAVGTAVKKGVQWAISQIEKLAPGAVAFFRNIKDYFKNAISKGLDSVFGGIVSSIRDKGLGATLADMVGGFASQALQAVGGFIAGQCAAIGQLAEYVLQLHLKLGSGILALVKKGFEVVKDKLDQLWTEYGAPALEWVTKKLKAIWKDVEDTATKIWQALKPLRDEIAEIWNAVTDFLAEGRRSYDAWMQGFVNSALDKWEEVKTQIKPYMGYVKTAAKVLGAVVILFSPAGPFVVAGVAIYGLYQGAKYVWEHWGKGFTKSVREKLTNELLPAIQKKLKEFRAKVDAIKEKVSGVLQSLYDAFMQVLGALGVLTFLAAVKSVFDFVTKKIHEFKDKLDKKLEEWSQKIRDLLTKADPYIQKIKEALRQTLLVATLGPLAIMDDGVWNTMKSVVRFIMKTPCLKELGGLLRVPSVMQTIDGFRANLKAMWKVIQNPDPLLEEIKKAIQPMIDKIAPGVREKVFNKSAAPAPATTGGGIVSTAKAPAATAAATAPAPAAAQLTPEQIKAMRASAEEQERKQLAAQLAQSGTVSEREAYISLSIWHYLADSLSELATNWWSELKKIGHDLIWPWPTVSKDFGPMVDHFGNAIDQVFELEFSKAIDEFLKGMKGFNSIAGALSGWFLLASVLIGSVLGALGFVTGPGGFATVAAGAGAGLEVAEAVGMGLLVVALGTEAAVMSKAYFDLEYQNLRIPNEEERNAADQEDCKDIAGSVVSLVTLGALFLLADIAARFAKWVYSLVENVPLVKNITTILKDFKKSVGDFSLVDQPGGPGGKPAAVGPEGGLPRDVTPEPGKTGEPPKAGEPEGRLSDDAGANAESKGVPREKLEMEVKELNQKAVNPDNVRRPADPRFDAEMDAQGHTFDREKAGKSWCRASDGPSCGLDLGGDLNAKVDGALKDKPAEPAKPVEEAPPTETKTEVPKEEAQPVDPQRAKLEADLEAAKAKKTAAEAKANDLRKQAEAHEARAKELDRQAAISRGEARAKLFEEARKAREAASEASKGADASFKDAVDAQKDIQKKSAQLNTDPQSQLPCFAAGTLVWTPSGPRPIDHLQPNDVVFAFDFAGQSVVHRQVLQVHQNKTMRFYDIEVGGSVIRSTSLHRFWNVSQSEWTEARHLRSGTRLHLFSGESAVIDNIEVREAPFANTFNLSVDENVTYFVGAGVLVHNTGYSFGNLRIYAGYNPKFPDKVYIGQTDDVGRRQAEHRAEAVEKLKEPNLTPEQREFWEFKKDIVLQERVSGLNPDQANYLEQKNMDIERGANNDLMNRREQVSKKNMPDLEKKIASDPKVQEAGLCQ